MTRLLALLLSAGAASAAQLHVQSEPVAPIAPGLAAAARLNSIVLSLPSLNAPSLAAPSLSVPSLAPAPAPAAFAQLDPASAARLSAVTLRLPQAAAAAQAAALGRVAAAAAPAVAQALPVAPGASLALPPAAANPPAARAPGDAAPAPERLPGVDVKELSAAVESVMGGLSPAQIGAMSDEDFNGGAERILAAMEGRKHVARQALYGPAAPDSVAAYLRDVSPGLERLTIAKFGMDHDRPDSFAACGPVSLAARDALRDDLRRRFPGSPNLDVILEPGRLDGPGEPVLHVFLKIVDRKAPGSILITPLAIFDLTAAQKPGNLTALGQDPRQRAALVLPWESDIYEKRYPFMRPAARDAGAMVDRIERARGPLSHELEAEMRAYLAGRP